MKFRPLHFSVLVRSAPGSWRSVSGLAATGSDVHDDGALHALSPQAITAEECVVIAAELGAGRQLLEFLGVAATQDHVVGAKRGLEQSS